MTDLATDYGVNDTPGLLFHLQVILTSPHGKDRKEKYKVAFGAPQDSFMPKVPLTAHLEMH